MKKRKSRVLVLLMMLTMLVLSAGTAQAASAKWTKAAKAYKTFLAKNESKYKVRVGDFKRKNTESTKKSAQFMLVDLNKDGVPELVTYYNIAYKMANLYVYTYKGGKVSRLKNSEIGVSYSAAGYYDIFVCTKNHFHVHYHAGFWNGIQQHIIYSVKNGKVVAKSGNYASHKAKKYLVDNTAAKRKKYCK